MSVKSNLKIISHNQTPGPGEYKDRNLDKGAKFVIGKAPRDKSLGFVNEIGPGNYNLKDDFFSRLC